MQSLKNISVFSDNNLFVGGKGFSHIKAGFYKKGFSAVLKAKYNPYTKTFEARAM
ncbi:hypothetical protein HY641_00845 [Candidatus Woesearchaeota archaeon]|nr:hypothetical protein [Candidatus Woesearchaeota archaeon]